MSLPNLSSLYRLLLPIWFIFMSNSAVHATDGAKKDVELQPFKILALGDSLTAGYGLPRPDGFVPQLSAWLNAALPERPTEITNAGVSGDTTQGGRSRLGWALAPFGAKGPDLVIVALGGNDGLRGIDPSVTRANMTAIVESLKKRGLPIFLVGMQAPPNLGRAYGDAFNSIFPDLAKAHNLPFYPFFLDGVAAVKELNQQDGIHPNKEGVAVIVQKMGPMLKQVIKGK